MGIGGGAPPGYPGAEQLGLGGYGGVGDELTALQMMNIQHSVMKLTMMAPNKQELRKIVQGMLAQDCIAEAHVMVAMMRMAGLAVDVVMYNLLMTAYKKSRQWQRVVQARALPRPRADARDCRSMSPRYVICPRLGRDLAGICSRIARPHLSSRRRLMRR